MALADEKIKFIESVFGAGRLSARSENIAVRCPVCESNDKTKRKLSVRLDDDLNHCWVCGWSARNLLPLLMKYGNSANVETYKREFLPLAQRKKDDVQIVLPTLPSDFKLLSCHENSSDPDVKALLRYVDSRGLSSRDIAYYALGFSDEFKYRRRIIIPSFDSDGFLNYVVSRAIDEDVWMRYVNSENPKSEIVFNDLKIDWKRPLNIVEGPFDLMKCPDNSTCLLGSEMNETHRLFVKILENSTPVVVCLDRDARKKAERMANKLLSYDIDVSLASLADDRDPGDLSKKDILDVLGSAKKWSRDVFISSKIKSMKIGNLRIS